jgi:hypothetical protein
MYNNNTSHQVMSHQLWITILLNPPNETKNSSSKHIYVKKLINGNVVCHASSATMYCLVQQKLIMRSVVFIISKMAPIDGVRW